MIKKLQKAFSERFNKEPMIIGAPGRVNLIGEHTDYNNGFVLPGAVDKRIYVAIAPNNTDKVNVFANQFNESYSFSINVSEPHQGWMNYLLGVSYHIQQKGKKIGGVDVIIDGDIPVGAGMSSSAALCSGFGFALNELFQLGLSRMELALIGQKTEHTFVGLKCGIMDQFASLHGKAGHVMKLDCRSLEYEYIPFNFPGHKIVLVNSMVSHSLASSEYNVRRQQCEEGIAILQKHYPNVTSLRDIEPAQLLQHKEELPPIVFDRCSYVVYEKERLLKGCEALTNNDLATFGKMMFATHEGLSKKYSVSCTELDFLAEFAQQIPGVVGARMMGGGFGGCTINIVQAEAVEPFTQKIQAAFNGLFKQTPEVYVTQIEDGVKIIS
ncbi:galactokinase [Niastella caeni]|uniref:Galactokinase n=1 Tax=Niastella caeni TaxID=2569763 RepID=A0A4S8I3J0_9BACT|nr:galactokinase [Niastella caeni]THU41594.1 galactokinase [Niastella caeni]